MPTTVEYEDAECEEEEESEYGFALYDDGPLHSEAVCLEAFRAPDTKVYRAHKEFETTVYECPRAGNYEEILPDRLMIEEVGKDRNTSLVPIYQDYMAVSELLPLDSSSAEEGT